MNHRICGFVFFLFAPLLVSSQSDPVFNWTHSWGGSGTDTGNAVATDSAGNAYVAGSTTSFGVVGQAVLLMKYDPTGHLLWARTWGGGNNESASGVLVDENGYIYVVGATNSFGAGWYDLLVLKFDSSGNLVWARTWGGGSYEAGYDLSFGLNGDLLVAAETYSFGTAATLLRVTRNGNVLSATTWKGPATYDAAYSIAVDASANTILAGISWDYSVYPNHNTILLLKFDSSGNLIWNRNWAGPSEDEAYGRKVVRTDAQGNIYVLGHTSASCLTDDFSKCIFDALLLKIDSDGNLIWAHKWGGTGSETPGGLWLDANDQLEAVGSTTSFFGGQQAALVQQYDGSGNLVASKILSSSGASGWNALAATASGALIATGFGPNNRGTWEDTGISSVIAPGSLTAPSGVVNHPTGSVGIPTGTTSDPTGVLDWGGGGQDVLTASFSEYKTRTATRLNASPNPSLVGQSVRIVAVVVAAPGSSGTPTGVVTFFDGMTSIGSASLNNGVATVLARFAVKGNHPIAAQYSGDDNFYGDVSPVLTEVVK